MKVLVFVGSLRAAAFSRKLAQAVVGLAPDGAECEFADGRDLPLYDQDLDGEEKPASVQALLDQVTAAEALVFVTPEFNYGIPGPLKNAIDWASRPAYNSPLKGKPSWVIGLSLSPLGGVRAHDQLQTVLSGTLTPTLLGPSFLVPAVHEKFDGDGALTDELTKARIERTWPAFLEWSKAQG